ncbi:hypothetical protein [Dyella flagellata]|uniref:DRBM domain-containing protein n=1 Tax=Dyella flagellata TaxID=1867833 RepID=A0ABQ5XBT5_9GAMM|nr:hypothetical protein GCM10007898_27270 [Dyella flagellata]
MKSLLRQEMFGKHQLSLIEVTHPSMPGNRGIAYEVRTRTPSGKFTRAIGDSSQGYASEDEAWQAGVAFVGRLGQ